MSQKKIAIIYDWIDKWGGVERVLQVLHTMYPQAVFYTSYYDKNNALWARSLPLRTSFIDSMPPFIKRSRIWSLPLYPYAFESLDLTEYDVVLSVTSSFAKGVITRPETKHICYLLTPTRFLWVHPTEYMTKGLLRPLASRFAQKLREWDYTAAQRPDAMIAISQAVERRCVHYYNREAEVIYPPFDCQYWENLSGESKPIEKDYYLVVSRLEPYKKVDVVIGAFNRTGKKLIVIGKGTQEQRLKVLAGPNISFIKDIPDRKLAAYYKHANATIMMQEEDFGLVSLEAQACGCPVIAYNRGGVPETIVKGKTGFLVPHQTEEALIDSLEIFHTISYNYRTEFDKAFKNTVQRFATDQFIRKISAIITN